jgi:basic membrane lipoprotein Med (substrate-binding protein (PBP1-ABC) superfamily)/class 3 adenylate cyclase
VESTPSSLLRTFLIADVRGYTRYCAEHGDEAAANVAARFAELARQGVAENGGELVELRGDEALAAFGSARSALRAAVELQRLFRSTDTAFPLGVGIGLDAGEPMPVEGGYRGGALNLASRLCSNAAAGEILASETVVSLARRIDGMHFAPRGTKRLKGLEHPVDVIEVVPDERLGPVPSERLTSLRRFRRRHLTSRTAIAGVLIALTAAAVAAGVLVVSGGGGSSASSATRVGLVIPRSEVASNNVLAPYVEGLIRARQVYAIAAETLTADLSKPTQLARIRNRLDDFDLVLVAGSPAQKALAEEVALHPGTRFMFLDPHLPTIGGDTFTKSPNYSDIFFTEGPGAYLAGALSALMARKQSGGTHPGVVSIVAGDEDVSDNQVAGFTLGVTETVPGTRLLVDYSRDFSHPSVCDAIANRQIDDGSQVIFAAAGECSLGALSAAGLRSVWGVGSDVDRSYLGPHVLASAVKRRDQAVDWAIRSYLDGTLPRGKLDVGIERNLVDLVGLNRAIPPDVLRTLASVRREHMKRFASFSTPLSEG